MAKVGLLPLLLGYCIVGLRAKEKQLNGHELIKLEPEDLTNTYETFYNVDRNNLLNFSKSLEGGVGDGLGVGTRKDLSNADKIGNDDAESNKNLRTTERSIGYTTFHGESKNGDSYTAAVEKLSRTSGNSSGEDHVRGKSTNVLQKPDGKSKTETALKSGRSIKPGAKVGNSRSSRSWGNGRSGKHHSGGKGKGGGGGREGEGGGGGGGSAGGSGSWHRTKIEAHRNKKERRSHSSGRKAGDVVGGGGGTGGSDSVTDSNGTSHFNCVVTNSSNVSISIHC